MRVVFDLVIQLLARNKVRAFSKVSNVSFDKNKLVYFLSSHLTNADDDKGSNSIEDAQVPHTKDNVVQKKSQKAAQSNASESKERQKHCRETRNPHQ